MVAYSTAYPASVAVLYAATILSTYYDKLVIEKNFKSGVPDNMKIYNFVGKMILDELSIVHRTAIKSLKKLMQGKENPTEMEKLLVELCDANGDFTDKNAIAELVSYCKD